MRVGIISQARMSSTRLPGKVMLELAGKPVLVHHLERLAWSGLDIHVATTYSAADDPISALCEELGVPVHRGSEADVLRRFRDCAKAARLDTVVRVTSDCPLVDGYLIGAAVREFVSWEDPHIYYSNCLERTFPRGLDFEVFSYEALEDACENAASEYEREHVTPYLNRNVSGRVELRHFVRSRDASKFRLTLDTEDDLRLLKLLFEEMGAARLQAEPIIELMEERGDLHAMNSHIEQKRS